jgi:hypothetical protein
MKLTPTETELIGRWEVVNGQVQADATCQRIEWLTSSYLEKITVWGRGKLYLETQMMAVIGNDATQWAKCREAVRPRYFY